MAEVVGGALEAGAAVLVEVEIVGALGGPVEPAGADKAGRMVSLDARVYLDAGSVEAGLGQAIELVAVRSPSGVVLLAALPDVPPVSEEEDAAGALEALEAEIAGKEVVLAAASGDMLDGTGAGAVASAPGAASCRAGTGALVSTGW